MFRNREIRIRVAKKNEATDNRTETPSVNPYAVADAAEEYTKKTIVVAVAGAAAIIILKTASEIAINAAPKR